MDMVGSQYVSKSIESPSEIDVSDVFVRDRYPEHVIVTGVSGDKIELLARDSLLNVGDEETLSLSRDEIFTNVTQGSWEYNGVFVYQGEDINGRSVDMKEILTPEAYDEYKSQREDM